MVATKKLKPTLANVKRVAASLGATVTVSGQRTITIYVDAPKGKFWNEGVTHSLVAASYDRLSADDYADLLDRMADGLEECDDPDCEYCHPELCD